MNSESLQKIQLNEIRDYRGNLSFAEQDNPIPFDIKSIFWGSISSEHSFTSSSNIFLICLSGEIIIENHTTLSLSKPCEAILIPKNITIKLSPLTDKCQLLLVEDDAIRENDKALDHNNNILEMPTTKHYGLQGCFANSNSTLPFDIKRVYFTYDIPSFAKRGGHAHINLESVIFPTKGQFDVVYHQQETEKTVQTLNTYNTGLHLKKETWRELENFEDNSIVLVLASDIYTEEDYIRYINVFNHYNFAAND